MGLPVCNLNETGYVSKQIQEAVHLHSSLGCAKRSPRINRQAKVYRRCVEGVNSRIQIDRQRVLRIKESGDSNQVLRKGCVDLPRAICVCMGKSVSRYLSTSESHVVKPGGLRSQIHFDIAQRLARSQLRKGHGKELIEASKVFDLVKPPVFRNASSEGVKGQVVHDLSKNEFAVVHLDSPKESLGAPF